MGPRCMPQVPPSMMRRSCNASSRCGCRKVDKKIAFLSFLLVFFVSNTLWRIVNITSATPINVALHAQVPPSTGMVVGSAITMAGVKEALLRRRGGSDHVPKEGVNAEIGGGRSSGNISIAHAQIFYPFNYAGLHDRRWDLVIIEGWFRMINVFIHEVRAISYPDPVIVLFYCLDPKFPELRHTSALDVDGFITNSDSTKNILLLSAPTTLIPLAVDTEAFPFFAEPSRTATGALNNGLPITRESHGRIVYVGAAGAINYKRMLDWMLREAIPYGLDIYGSGWQDVPEFSVYWRGVLPEGDLASVYGRAVAVIGVTSDNQRASGMINNRVFEAMSVGAPLISEHFPALESLFGDALLYVKHPGDVARHIEHILHLKSSPAGRIVAEEARWRRRNTIEDRHTWAHRVEKMLSFAASFSSHSSADKEERRTAARCSSQRGCLKLAIVVDFELVRDVTFGSTFVPTIDLLTPMYRVSWWIAPWNYRDNEETRPRREEIDGEGNSLEKARHVQLPRDLGHLRAYDIVWAAGRWGGPADRVVRVGLAGGNSSTPRVTTLRLAVQLRGIVLWGALCTPSSPIDGWNKSRSGEKHEESCSGYAGGMGLRGYDVVYCRTRWDHALLKQLVFEGAVSDNLQQAWGIGPQKFVANSTGNDKSISNLSPSYDILLVGTDDQIPDMLRHIKSSGRSRLALAVLVFEGGFAERPNLTSILEAAGVYTGIGVSVDVMDLPQRLSLYVVESKEDSAATPLATEVLLIRCVADTEALAEFASAAAKITVVATGQVGLWATLVTIARGQYQRRRGEVQTIDTNDGGRYIQDLIDQWPEAWDTSYYAHRLIAGMTRAFCLGRGNSRISLVNPIEGSVNLVGVSDTIKVDVSVDDFDVGMDGQWCITVGGRVLLCLLRNQLDVGIHISSSANESEWSHLLETARLEKHDLKVRGDGAAATTPHFFMRLELVVELRSNVYKDVLQRSQPAVLLIDPTGLAANENVRCDLEEGHFIVCDQTTAYQHDRIGIGMLGKRAHIASLDIKDFFQPSPIEVVGVTRITTKATGKTSLGECLGSCGLAFT